MARSTLNRGSTRQVGHAPAPGHYRSVIQQSHNGWQRNIGNTLASPIFTTTSRPRRVSRSRKTFPLPPGANVREDLVRTKLVAHD